MESEQRVIAGGCQFCVTQKPELSSSLMKSFRVEDVPKVFTEILKQTNVSTVMSENIKAKITMMERVQKSSSAQSADQDITLQDKKNTASLKKCRFNFTPAALKLTTLVILTTVT
tara:strand:- start:179 stop:523 length:345 start_codon:yes stop_codon:yes gene_type:complete